MFRINFLCQWYAACEQRYVGKKGIAVTCATRHADDTLIPLAILALEYPCPFFTVREHGAEFAQEGPRGQSAIQYVASVGRWDIRTAQHWNINTTRLWNCCSLVYGFYSPRQIIITRYVLTNWLAISITFSLICYSLFALQPRVVEYERTNYTLWT